MNTAMVIFQQLLFVSLGNWLGWVGGDYGIERNHRQSSTEPVDLIVRKVFDYNLYFFVVATFVC